MNGNNQTAQEIVSFIKNQPPVHIRPQKRQKETSLVKKLMMKPIKDTREETPHFQRNYPKDFIHQADLLYLPHEKGSKYVITVVDMSSRLVDAEPLKKRDADSVIEAIKIIYKRNILSMPKEMQTDAGAEFKGNFNAWLESND